MSFEIHFTYMQFCVLLFPRMSRVYSPHTAGSGRRRGQERDTPSCVGLGLAGECCTSWNSRNTAGIPVDEEE